MVLAKNMENKKSDEIIIEMIDDNIKNPMDAYCKEVGITAKQPKTIEDVKNRFNELLNAKPEDGFVVGCNLTTDSK